jgi:hypothetical protein
MRATVLSSSMRTEGVPLRLVGDHVRHVDHQDLRAALALERLLLERTHAAEGAEPTERHEAAGRRDGEEEGEGGAPHASWWRRRDDHLAHAVPLDPRVAHVGFPITTRLEGKPAFNL